MRSGKLVELLGRGRRGRKINRVRDCLIGFELVALVAVCGSTSVASTRKDADFGRTPLGISRGDLVASEVQIPTKGGPRSQVV